MKKILAFSITGALILFFILAGLYAAFIEQQDMIYDENETISIIAWNLQIFGDKKANNSELMQNYVDILDGYDIIILQEIRDSDGSAFNALCSRFEGYTCKISSRAGRSTSKEQYAVLYRNTLELKEFKDYNPDAIDRWERPPAKVDFSNENNYSFSIYILHAKPEDATNEIVHLEELVESEISSGLNTNIIILGDLNADCAYYDELERDFFDYYWIIKNNEDTTAGNSNCAYDRIIVNENMMQEIIGYDIDKTTNTEMSDHYPITMLIRNKEHVRDTSFKKFILWLFLQ
ncbi:MAG TPA: endonuclease/exonuclease/phosphatase family protein [Alphaproteobacteria bacterium]|nr:endonuclease/exonuclease/phosphatase family protein [Alphaproteobacteria bacterium]